MKKQQGFTLVEIAIVMVIIGLLLGGALKGQEMITNAKLKRVKAEYDQYVAAFFTYQDIYRAIPGDNPNAASHGGVSATGQWAGSGRISNTWDDPCDTDDSTRESCLFWDHLRSAGLIPGAGAKQPASTFGGRVGVQYALESQKVAFSEIHMICFGSIPEESARILDLRFDDGNGLTGSFRDEGKKPDYARTKAICMSFG